MMHSNICLNNLHIIGSNGSQNRKVMLEIQGNRISRILPAEPIASCKRNMDLCLDLEGFWAAPAFTDCHFHLLAYSQSEDQLHLEGLNRNGILEQISTMSSEYPVDSWIIGRGWEMDCWEGASSPTADDLDPISGLHPIALSSKDGHTLWLNSIALLRLGFDSGTCDPSGGKFERKCPDGPLTGILRENAAEMAMSRLPKRGDLDAKRGLIRCIQKLHSLGITAIHNFEDLRTMDLLMQLHQERQLDFRVLSYCSRDELDDVIREGFQTGSGNHILQFGGLKLYADGALGSKTAAVTQPYDNDPENFGLEVLSRKELTELAVHASRHHISCAIHAIGDRAVSNAVAALSQAALVSPLFPGHRIEHIQLLDPSDKARFSQYNITASLQPFHLLSDFNMVESNWQHQRVFRYPCRSLIEAGIRVVFGSDAPIDNVNPFEIMKAAVTRMRRDGFSGSNDWALSEKISVPAARNAYTCNPASLEKQLPVRGRLEEGMIADLIIVAENPDELGSGTMKAPLIIGTLMDGKIVYRSPGFNF